METLPFGCSCNCGPCRKADGKSPTGQRVFAARVAGFDNVHDFLVHLETGESPLVIARRKDGREWTNGGRFKCEEAPEDFLTESHKDSCLDGHKDVAPRTTDMSTKLQRKILCRKYAKKVLLVCVIYLSTWWCGLPNPLSISFIESKQLY